MSLVVHIGLPKTATTTLQEALFANHTQLVNVGRPYPSEDARWAVFHLVPSRVPDLDPEQAQRDLERWCGPVYDASGPVVLSDEVIAAEGPDAMSEVADRCQTLLPPCEIMLTIREPLDLTESMYLQDMRGAPERWPYRPIDEWIEVQWKRLQNGQPSRLDRLRFADFLAPFEATYGTDRVNVLTFEQLSTDDQAFTTELADIMDIDPKETLTHVRGDRKKERIKTSDLRLKRLGNVLPIHRIIPHLPDPVKRLGRRLLGGHDRADKTMDSRWEERIREFARPHCQHLAGTYDLALGDHGYPVDP